MNSHGEAEASDREIDLIVFWQVLTRYRLLIALVTVVCTAGAAAYALTTTPLFRAEVTISDARDNNMGGGSGGNLGQLGGLASLAGVTLGSGSAAARDAHAVLKSHQLAQQFVERHGLTAELTADSGGTSSLWRAVRRFQKDVVNVDEDRRSGMIGVSVTWRDRAKAATWANDYVALANEVIRARAATDAQRNITYLEGQLKLTGSVEVQRALANLIETETKTLMLAQGRAEFAFTVIDPAVTPEVKASPKVTLVILVGMVSGLLAGVLLALAHFKISGYRRRAQTSFSVAERG
ncbi:MAG TPA: Wzz/FepE/Etk N-terminal domain-containing protein [Steroidobacteraceae bacterium]|nr:Wzz/FepE/Etk N-terminal domain-containing protein [Steroidobacteraceae bacterium]